MEGRVQLPPDEPVVQYVAACATGGELAMWTRPEVGGGNDRGVGSLGWGLPGGARGDGEGVGEGEGADVDGGCEDVGDDDVRGQEGDVIGGDEGPRGE